MSLIIRYTYKDGKDYKCYPDIVIWNDIEDPNMPPDAKGDVNFPMRLTLEIKLEGQLDEKNKNWDIEKMEYLLHQGDTQYACWLNFCWKRTKKGNGISWKLSDSEKLWICKVMLPASKQLK